MAELVDLGAATLDPKTKAPLFQCKGAPLSSNGDAPDYGATPLLQCLGVTTMPYPADENGGAQGVMVDVEGLDGVLVGARDTRTAAIVGNLKPGDCCVHSVGPEQAAQLQLKEEKRQAVLVSKDTQGKTMVIAMDGKNDKITIAGFGCAFEMSRENGIVLTDETGAAVLQLKGGQAILCGNSTVLGGRTPIATIVAGTGGPAAVAVPGLFAGG